jgi:hypothetical protein
MKIDIEITKDQLYFINEMIADNLLEAHAMELKQDKSFIYMMHDISNKLLKKTIEKRDSSKPLKLSLKYYEAFTLHQFLLMYSDYEETEKRRLTRGILAIINQKIV